MENEHKEKPKKNLLEWTVFSVSLLLVMALIVYLVYKTVTHQPLPPDISVMVSPDPTASAPHRYHLFIGNTGGETAEEVRIELSLYEGGKVMERSGLQIPFVPQQSKRESWINFTSDPSQADSVVMKVVSFKKP